MIRRCVQCGMRVWGAYNPDHWSCECCGCRQTEVTPESAKGNVIMISQKNVADDLLFVIKQIDNMEKNDA